MKTILFFVAVASIQATAFGQQNVANLLEHYLHLKNALFENEPGEAVTLSGHLLQSLDKSETFDHKNAMVKSVNKIMGTRDIEKQRAALADLSEILWQSIKDGGAPLQPVYYYYCPMKKVYWLSTEAVITNPYYGSVMPSCGTLTDQKNPQT
jgi:hypothetical protein